MLPNFSKLGANRDTVLVEAPKRDHDGPYSRGEATESGQVILNLDAGDRLTGHNYKNAVRIMEDKIESIIRAWAVSLATTKGLGMTINGHHFEWVVDNNDNKKPQSYELIMEDRPDRLIAVGRGQTAARANAREKLQALYDEDKDLFYTVMLAFMSSGKVTPHFFNIN